MEREIWDGKWEMRKRNKNKSRNKKILILTSLCRHIKHFTRRPPIEWLMMFIFFPPEALYANSSCAANRSNVSGNLKKIKA
jgi:hypothetical protein